MGERKCCLVSKRVYDIIPIKSVGIFPLQNLPVATFPGKSLPYGG